MTYSIRWSIFRATFEAYLRLVPMREHRSDVCSFDQSWDDYDKVLRSYRAHLP
jgi:hypothetical protein